MKLLIRDDANSVTEWAAKYVIKRINVSIYVCIRVDHQNSSDSNGFETYLIQNAISFQAFHPGPDRFFVLGLPTGGDTINLLRKL